MLQLLPKVPSVGSGAASGSGPGASQQHPLGEHPRADVTMQRAAAAAAAGAGGSHRGKATGADDGSGCGAAAAGVAAGGGGGVHALSMQLPVGPCPVCGARDILLPYVAQPCCHVFCYYCLAAHCSADGSFACPLDGERVDGMQRLVRRVPSQLQ